MERAAGLLRKSGAMTKLIDLMTAQRAAKIATIVKDPSKSLKSKIDPRLSFNERYELNKDASYYSLAIQTGYLTFMNSNNGEYDIKIPNDELVSVWKNSILENVIVDPVKFVNVIRILSEEPLGIEKFDELLFGLISEKLLGLDLENSLRYHDLPLKPIGLPHLENPIGPGCATSHTFTMSAALTARSALTITKRG
jgi:hypothetical protein